MYHLPTYLSSTYTSFIYLSIIYLSNLHTYLPTYHLTSHLSIIYLLIDYLLSTYLSFIYRIYLPTHLWLVFLEKAGEHRCITKIQPTPPNPLHASASQWHNFEEQSKVCCLQPA